MSADQIAVAKRLYAARNRGQVDAVLAECDPDVEWHPHLATLGGKPIFGHTGVREYMASLTEDWEYFHHEPEEFFGVGDNVVAFVHTSARGKSSGIELDGTIFYPGGGIAASAATPTPAPDLHELPELPKLPGAIRPDDPGPSLDPMTLF